MKGKTDYLCKIKEALFIQELELAFNVNVGSEKLLLIYSSFYSLLISTPYSKTKRLKHFFE